jgi:hypothetical protein
MNYVASITIDEVIEALADVLAPFCPGAEIVRGQVNRTPQPRNPCVILTEIGLTDLQVPSAFTDPSDQETTLSGPQRIGIQIDFYGSKAGEWCSTAKQVLRSAYGFANMPDDIKPLYTDDGRQAPLISGEQQYETRWILMAALQYNPVSTVPQPTATALQIDEIVAADINYT